MIECPHKISRRGTTAVETAVALSMLIVMIGAGAWFLSDCTNQIFARVAQVPGPDGKIVSGDSKTAQPATEKPTQNPKPASLLAEHWQAGAVIALLVCGAAAQAWLLMRTRKRVRKHEEEDFPLDETELATLNPAVVDKRQDLLRHLALLQQRGMLRAARVKDVMSHSLFTVKPELPMDELAAEMKQRRVRHVLVCNQDMHLAGVISDRDLAQRHGKAARDIMSKTVVTVAPDMELIPAITTMMNRNISALPVLQANKVIGILTTTDIMLILQCMVLLEHRTACDHEGEETARLTGTSLRAVMGVGNVPTPTSVPSA